MLDKPKEFNQSKAWKQIEHQLFHKNPKFLSKKPRTVFIFLKKKQIPLKIHVCFCFSSFGEENKPKWSQIDQTRQNWIPIKASIFFFCLQFLSSSFLETKQKVCGTKQ
jgi:hypothetical protein